MPKFQLVGDPRFQAPPTPFQTPVAGNPALVTKAGFRQFEWIGRIRLDGPAQDSFEAGFIQNMVKCSIEMLYSTGEDDKSPIRAEGVVDPLPILDSKQETRVWLGGDFALLGTQTLDASVIVPSAISRQVTNTDAAVSAGDDPGGRFPIVHPQDRSRLLRQVIEQLDFVTWAAVRERSKPERDVTSYEFLRFVTWVVRRKTLLHHNGPGRFAAVYLENKTGSVGQGAGIGKTRPVLVLPIANKKLTFRGISLTNP